MTKKELSQLYYLKKEIKEQQKRIEELETAASSCTSKITGMPNGALVSDRVGIYAAQIADLKALLDLNLKRCFYELNRLERYIQSIEDTEMKLIFSLRYINGMKWKDIAIAINYQDESVPRKRHNRFLKKQ